MDGHGRGLEHLERRQADPDAELPAELVGCEPGDANEAAVYAVEVVRGAERDQVRWLVAPALGAELDVVRVGRRRAAARDLTEAAVALAAG